MLVQATKLELAECKRFIEWFRQALLSSLFLVSVGLRVPANAIASNIRMSACTRRGFWTSATAWSAQPASPEYGAGVRTAEPYAGERNGNSSARADLVAGRTGRGDGAEQVYCHGVRGSAHHHHVGSQSGPMELGCDRLRR